MMFSVKSKKLVTAGGGTSIIGSAVTLTGDIVSTTDIRIDGIVRGNVQCDARILIGNEGRVEGDLISNQADVMGTVKGNIRVKDLLTLRGTATVNGNIFAAKLQVEPSVTFNGNCNMSQNVVEMITDVSDKPKQPVAKVNVK